MKHLLLLIALAASAQQIKINPITGLPDLVGSSASGVASVTAGPLGALVCTPTTGAVVCDVDSAYVPNKAGSATITGAWTFSTPPTGIGGGTARTTYAALPACTSANSGTLYKLTDSIYEAQCNGTSYAYWTGQKYIPTLPWSNGTTFGAGATVTATTGSVLFDGGAPTGGDSIRAAVKALPAAPYTVILDIDMLQGGTVGSSSCGLVITDGTTAASNNVITLMQSYLGLNMTKLSNATTWNSNYTVYTQSTSRNKISYRLVDDNTNRTWSVSQDRINWTQVSQQSRTDFMTATHYGYGCNMTGVAGIVTMVVEGLYAQ
jgi:hypothetical protein